MNALLEAICRPAHLLTALKVAAVVGTALNIVNQGHVLMSGTIDWTHFLMNYFIPFLVSSYSSGKAQLTFRGDESCDGQ